MSDSASHHSTVGEKDRQMEGSTGEGERSGGPQTRLDRAEADIMSWQNKAFALEQEKNDLLKETATVKQKERELEEKLSNVISTWAKAAGRSSRGTAEHVLACAAEGASPDWAIVLEAQEDFPALVLPQMVSSTRPVYRNRLDDIEGNRMAIFVEHLSPPVHNDDTHPATNVVKLLHDVISEKPTFLDDARHAYEYIQFLDTTLRGIDSLEPSTQSWDCFARLT